MVADEGFEPVRGFHAANNVYAKGVQNPPYKSRENPENGG